MKRIIIPLITAAIFLASCTKEIEFRGEETDPKLVVNSLVEPGKAVSARIGKSVFFLDNHPDMAFPEGLTATLFVNGNRIGEMLQKTDTVWNGYTLVGDSLVPDYALATTFFNPYRPSVGDVVKITASANGFDAVEGETSALPRAVACAVIDSSISDWDASYIPAYDSLAGDSILHGSCQLDLVLEVSDPTPGTLDFFRLRFKEGSDYGDDTDHLSYFASYEDPIFNMGVSGENEFVDFSDLNIVPLGVFTDALFDGKSYQIKVPVGVEFHGNANANPDFFRIEIYVEHLSKEYHNYLNTCDQGDEIMQFFAEPVQTYSNVKGGYGLVGGLWADTLWTALPLEE